MHQNQKRFQGKPVIRGRINTDLLPQLGFIRDDDNKGVWKFYDSNIDKNAVLVLYEPLPNGNYTVTYRNPKGKFIYWKKVVGFDELQARMKTAREILIEAKEKKMPQG